MLMLGRLVLVLGKKYDPMDRSGKKPQLKPLRKGKSKLEPINTNVYNNEIVFLRGDKEDVH